MSIVGRLTQNWKSGAASAALAVFLGVFFPALPTVPMMIAFFAIAHLLYIRLFLRHLTVRPLARWSLVYIVWWVVLLVVLWPHLGGLSFAVAAYGIVLGGTAAASTRANRVITWGGVLFLASDTLLAFLLFTPQLTDPAVMLTYTLGQGLIAVGAVRTIRARRIAAAGAETFAGAGTAAGIA